MKKSGLRHNNPLPIPRRGGTRLIEGKSPKLGRRVRLFNYASFAIWVARVPILRACSFRHLCASSPFEAIRMPIVVDPAFGSVGDLIKRRGALTRCAMGLAVNPKGSKRRNQ